MKADQKELLDSVLNMVDGLEYRDENGLDRLRRRGRMIVGRVCGEDSPYLHEFNGLYFHPMYAPASEEAKREAWDVACQSLINIINTIKEEMELFPVSDPGTTGDAAFRESSSSVFVVHGHDEELKQSVARLLENLELNPVILHEKPNKGRTIIEKFTDYSDVGFAVILLSADDRVQGQDGKVESFRARQNVILELGFFLGRLGRERVIEIFRPHEQFEMPSDYSGVLFIEYDTAGAWRYRLGQEMREVGYEIDFNKIR
jgi:predicted nucleotide-binding protein